MQPEEQPPVPEITPPKEGVDLTPNTGGISDEQLRKASEAFQQISAGTLDAGSSELEAPIPQDLTPEPTPIRHNRKPFFVIAGVALGIIILLGLVGVLSGQRRASLKERSDQVAEQEINLGQASKDKELAVIQLRGADQSLVVNGDVVATDSIAIQDRDYFGEFVTENNLTANQQYILPDASGVICISSNNCGYARLDQLITPVTLQGGSGVEVSNAVIHNRGVLSINGSSGSLSVLGTPNQISVSTSGSTITLAGPQDLAVASSPTFANLTVTTSVTQNGNVVCDISNNCGFSSVANSFVQNGNSFGAGAVLGTNDNFGLSFETNNVERLHISNQGNVTVGGTTAVNSGLPKLYVPYVDGDAGASAGLFATNIITQFGDNTNPNNNSSVGIYSYSGVALEVASVTNGAILGFSNSTTAGAISGLNFTAGGSGVAGAGDIFGTGDGVGVFASSANDHALRANSSNNTSGFFQAKPVCPLFSGCSDVNTAPTLVTKQLGSLTADLFQVQNSSGTPVASIGYNGAISTTSTLDVQGHSALGAAATISSDIVLNVSETFTNTAGNVAGAQHTIDLGPASASSANAAAAANTLLLTGSSNFTGFLYGGNSSVNNNSTGTSSFAFGHAGGVTNASTGNIAIAYGLTGALQNASSGNITFLGSGVTGQVTNTGTGNIANGIALFAAAAANTGGGTITNNYGLNVQPQTAGINDYGIRVDAADTQTLWISGATDATTANAGIAFGASRDTNLYRSGANLLRTDDVLSVGTLGATDTATYLCYNSLSQLAACTGSGTGAAFVNGGNSFGGPAILGTNDSNSLSFETNNATQATIAVGGATTFQNSINSTDAFRILNQGGTINVFKADTTNGRVAINGAAGAPAANLQVQAVNATDVVSQVQGTTGQTGDLHRYVNSTNQILSRVDAGGNLVAALDPPTTPATAAINATAGNLNGAYNYVVTYVTAQGETFAGPVSNTINPANQQADVTNIPTGPPNVVARKIYRTTRQVDGVTNSWRFVTQINDNITTTYTDNTADTALTYAPPMPIAAPQTGPLAATNIFAAGSLNGNYSYKLTYITPWGETEASPVSNTVTLTNQFASLIRMPFGGVKNVTAMRIYRTAANGSTYFYAPTQQESGTANNVSGTITDPSVSARDDNSLDATLNTNITPPSDRNTANRPVAPSASIITSTGNLSQDTSYVWAYSYVNGSGGESAISKASNVVTTTAANKQASVTGITAGPSGTVARKLYRSLSMNQPDGFGGFINYNVTGPFVLVATIGDNSTTSYTDNISDNSLTGEYAQLSGFVTPGLAANQLKVTAPQGTPPLIVSSTTMVRNLNAELLGGNDQQGIKDFTYNMDESLKHYRSSLANAHNQPVVINFIGDSITWGLGSSDRPNRSTPALVEKALKEKYGDGGSGFQKPFDNTRYWTHGANGTYDFTYSGVGGGITMCNAASGLATTTTTFRGSKVDIQYTENFFSGLDTLNYSVDNGAITGTIVQSASFESGKRVSISNLDPVATHTITFTVPDDGNGGNGYECAVIEGVDGMQTAGVRVNNLATSSTYTHQSFSADDASIGSFNPTPDLVVFAYGTNEQGTSTPPTMFKENYQKWIGQAKRASKPADCILVIPAPQSGDDTAHRYNSKLYRDVIYELAQENGCGVLDLHRKWNESFAWAQAEGLYTDGVGGAGTTDGLHLSDKGVADVASSLINVLNTGVKINYALTVSNNLTQNGGQLSVRALSPPLNLRSSGTSSVPPGTLTPGNTYRYVVTALNDYGESNPSEEKVFTVPNTGIFVNAGVMRIQWDTSPGATKYRIYRCPTANCVAGTPLSQYYETASNGINDNGSLAWITGATPPQISSNNSSYAGTLLQGSSSSALSVMQQNGDEVVNIDTSQNQFNLLLNSGFEQDIAINLLTNSNFEQSIAMWALKGGATIARDGNYYFEQGKSLKVSTTAAANDGARYPITLTNNTAYELTFWARTASVSGTFLAAGYANDGSTDTNCTLNTTTVSGSWQQYSCILTTTTTSGSPYMYIKQTDATARDFYIDNVTLKAVGSPVGWAAKGNASVRNLRTETQKYAGKASMQLTTTANANDGARYNISLVNGTTYTLSFYARMTSGSSGSLRIGYAADGSTETNCTPKDSFTADIPALSTSGWQQVSCQITPSSGPTGTPYIYIDQADSVARTVYIDAIQLELGSSVRSYSAGTLSLNGTITSPILFRNGSDSVSAFQIQNAAQETLFNVDTLNEKISVISQTSSTTGSTTASMLVGAQDNGVVTSGTDTTIAQQVQVTRGGATGGTINVYGVDATAVQFGGGIVTDLIGVRSTVGTFLATGTTTNAYALYGVSTPVGGGTFTNTAGLHIASATTGGGGTIGTNYGIQVKAQTAGTTDYGIAIEAADTQTLWISSNADNTTAAAGIAFGSSRDTGLYRSGANILRTDDTLEVTGNIGVGTLGSADTSTQLCRNTINQIATCMTTGAGVAFINGGNSFGGTATLGTNDNNDLVVRTNSNTRMTVAAGGDIYIGNGITNAAPVSGVIQATGATGTNTSGAALTLAGGRSTGSAAGGNINLQISPSGVGGSSLNPLVTTLTINGDSGVITSIGQSLSSAHALNIQSGASSAGWASQLNFRAESPAVTYSQIRTIQNGSGSGATADMTLAVRRQGSVVDRIVIAGNGATTITQVAGTTNDTLIVNNSTSTGAILALQDNGTAVMRVADGGAASFQNSVNSSQGFRIQNAAGNNLVNVNTLTSSLNLVQNASIENAATGWAARGAAAASTDDTQFNFGARSLKVATTAAANDGAAHSYRFSPSTQYTLSFFARLDSGSATTINIGRADNGSDTDCLTGQTVNTTWTQFSCTFTTGATIGTSSNFYIKQTDAVARNIFIDGVTLVTGGTALIFTAPGNNLQVDAFYGNTTINGQMSGEIQPWQTDNTSITGGRFGHGSVIANGYMYVIGGNDGAASQSTVYYAKINNDGSVGSWNTNVNTLPAIRDKIGVAAYNGYVYVVGGWDGTTPASTVYYAKVNADGSTGPWITTPNVAGARRGTTLIAANGFLYSFGANTSKTNVYYARLHPDGTVGNWVLAANDLLSGRESPSAVIANGFVYVIGGDSAGTGQTTVYYARMNSDGSYGTWTTASTTIPSGRWRHTSVVVNGYLYVLGGTTNGTTPQSTVYFAKINNNGSLGTFQTSNNPLPAARMLHTSVAANGYIYSIGGTTNGTTNALADVMYASTARLVVGGSLDLVGLTGGNYADVNGDSSLGSVGGSLTAGNTRILGALDVQGQSNFSQSVYIEKNLRVNGALTVQSNSINQTGEATGLSNLSDMTTQGRYTYVTRNGASDSLTIIDSSNPISPSTLGTVSTTDNPTTVQVMGRYAYVTTAAVSNNFQVFDVANPSTPVLVGQTTLSASSGTVMFTASGRYAYVRASTSTIDIVDLSNPTAPTLVLAGFSVTTSVSDMFIQGSYLYIVHSSSPGRISIYDVSNPASPVLLGTTTTSMSNGTNGLFVKGRYAYTTSTSDTLQIIDVANPAAPVVVSTVATTPSPTAPFAQGHYVYLASGAGSNPRKFQAFDVTIPSTPYLVATSPENLSNAATAGPYIQGRYAYLSQNGGSKVSVWDLGGAYVQQLEVGGLEASTLTTSGDLSIGNSLAVTGGANITNGLSVQGASSFKGGITVYGLSSFSHTLTDTTASTASLSALTLTDTGVVTSGNDITQGQNIAVTRSGSTGGTVDTYGLNVAVTADSGGAGTATAYGIYSLVQGNVIGTSADSSYAGYFRNNAFGGNVTTPAATAIQAHLFAGTFGGTYTLTDGYAMRAQIAGSIFGGSATITNGYGLQIQSANMAVGSSITNQYGIHVQAQTAGTTSSYGVAIDAAGTQTLWLSSNADNTTAAAGIAFGSSRDTNLYRGAANQLRTGDDLFVDLDLDVASQAAIGSGASIAAGTVLAVNETYTNLSGSVLGVSNIVTLNQGADSTTILMGENVIAQTTDNNAFDATAVIASRNDAEHDGDGDLGSLLGVYGYASYNASATAGSLGTAIGIQGQFDNWSSRATTAGIGVNGYSKNAASGSIGTNVAVSGTAANEGSGNITTNRGVSVQNSLSGAGNITTNTGLYVATVTDTGGGAITDNYGIHVEAQTAGTSDYGLRVDAADTQTLWVSGNANNTTAAAGIAFGSSRDTNLYRSGADILRTDDNFDIASKLQVGTSGGTFTQCATVIGLGTCSNSFEVTHSSVETTTGTTGNSFLTGITPAGATNTQNNRNIASTLILFGTQSFSGVNASIEGYGVNGATAGTVTELIGVIANAQQAGIGSTVTDLIGANVRAHQTGGTVTNAYGLRVVAASGTIGTNYGIQVKAQTVGTTDYGIAVEAADTQTLWISSNADNTTAAAGIAFGSSRDTNLYRSAADRLKTDDSVEITGSVGVGVAPGTYKLNVNTDSSAGYVANFFNDGNNQDRYGIQIQAGADDGSGTTYYLNALDGDGTQIGYISRTAGVFGITDLSDARTKTNISDTSIDGLDIINRLRVTDFNRNSDPNGALITGFIAQEVQDVYGAAVTEGENGYLGVMKEAFIPVLVKAVQQQQAQINQLAQQQGGSFANLNVSGAATVNSLTVTGTATIAKLTVTGDAVVQGDLYLDGKLIGNGDTRGQVVVPAGEVMGEYTFSSPYEEVPNIVLTATNAFAPQYRVEATLEGFKIHLKDPLAEEIRFNFQAQQ